MTKKTKESITQSWEHKYKQYCFNARIKKEQKIDRIREQNQKNLEYQIEKINRKHQSDLSKKKLEYERKAKNEIRALEGKPQREYKTKHWTRNQKLQFALDIAQENSKLRDTDKNWEGFCISCNQKKSWSELAGGHRYSRMFQSICLHKANINAQCHSCNWTTWPSGCILEAEKINTEYDKNIIKKRGEDKFLELQLMKQEELSNPVAYKWTEIKLDELIPDLITENERLWETKNFYKPKKNWREIYEKELKRE